MEFEINKEFESLLPTRTEQNLKALEQDILIHGITEPIQIWNGIILKGIDTYRIAEKHEISIIQHLCELDFENISEAKIWVIESELCKPQLCAYTRAALVIKYESIVAEQVKQDKSTDKKYTDERLAAMAGISTGSLFKVRKILTFASDEDKARLINEEVSINEIFNSLPNPKPNSDDKPAELIAEPEPKPRKDLSAKKQINFNVIVHCDDEIEQEQTYNKLCEEGYKCKVSA